jgi:Zn finger protein HypA/HybF involved in hydrogenase expression
METDQHAQVQLPVEFAGPRLLCTACGYDLRGLVLDGRCPECGTPVSESLARGSRRVFKPGAPVAAEQGVNCVHCGADLVGQSSHAGCARCGAPVWLSLDGDWLCVRHPAWLRRVRCGASLWFGRRLSLSC